MPYAFKVDQAIASRKWYLENKATVIERKRLRRAAHRRQLTVAAYLRAERLQKLAAHNREVFASPRGRICLIRQCNDCRRFAYVWVGGARKYGAVDSATVARSISIFSESCDDCYRYGQFSKVMPCDMCGRFKRHATTGVDSRWDCRDCHNPDSTTPYLCVSCWNRVRPVHCRLRDAEELRRFINKLKREVGSVGKDYQLRTAQGISGEHDDRGEGRRCEGGRSQDHREARGEDQRELLRGAEGGADQPVARAQGGGTRKVAGRDVTRHSRPATGGNGSK